MAITQLSAIVADIRGSVGGNTFSRNRGGAFVRKRVVPINPNTTRQGEARQRVSSLSQRWSATLTAAQRSAWIAYAEATTWTNRLGAEIGISGLSAYVRTNSLRLLAGLSPRDDGPALDGHAAAPEVDVAAYHDADEVAITEFTSGFDPDVSDSVLFVFQGLPLGLGRYHLPNQFRYVGCAEGDDTTPPTAPITFDAAFAIAEDRRVTIATVHQDAAGRISNRVYDQAVSQETP